MEWYYWTIIIVTLIIAIAINLLIGHLAKKHDCYEIMKIISGDEVRNQTGSLGNYMIVILTMIFLIIGAFASVSGIIIFIMLFFIILVDLPKFCRYIIALDKVKKKKIDEPATNNKYKSSEVDSNIGDKVDRFNNKNKVQDYSEEDLENYDLEDWQKDLVRKGLYDPENFEEDDSEDEDDYYHEDDR